jgi:hypothetical protein
VQFKEYESLYNLKNTLLLEAVPIQVTAGHSNTTYFYKINMSAIYQLSAETPREKQRLKTETSEITEVTLSSFQSQHKRISRY